MLVPTSQARFPSVESRLADTPFAKAEEYGFLVSVGLDFTTLLEACQTAERWGVYPHDVLIANGYITEEAYVRAFAAVAGVDYLPRISASDVMVPGNASLSDCLENGILQQKSPVPRLLLSATRLRPFPMRALIAQLASHRVALAAPRTLREAIAGCFSSTIAHDAVWALKSHTPHLSAHRPLSAWQLWSVLLGAIAFVAAALMGPHTTVYAVSIALACLFIPIVVLRLRATLRFEPYDVSARREDGPRDTDSTLPTYTVLVPLYREAHMLQPLLCALLQLDWPAAKLDIKLVLEASDTVTLAAARALRLPGNVEIVAVPSMGPRTKPKALNYALPLARGDYLVVYDAEDRPEPDQLRRAFRAFQNGPPNLAATQARLNIYNSDANWLTRQFAIEYSALFDGLLPLLDSLKLPIPLGGTSNHFRVAALRRLLAWDPFNVTEDADLGTRLSRFGYCCTVIASTTYEEAPVRLGAWIRQRTRWLKGFVQTFVVHMSNPRALLRQLGFGGFLAFQIMVGGTILTALLHPWFYVLLVMEVMGGRTLLALPETVFGLPFWAVSAFSVAAGYATAMVLGLIAVRQRRLDQLRWHVLLMPVY